MKKRDYATTQRDSPLVESGLVGPVTLQKVTP